MDAKFNNKNTNIRKVHVNQKDEETKLHQTVAQDHPEWVDKDGECQACVSMSHDLADPHYIPDEVKSTEG